ncbi:MAG: hypothetical protein ACP5I1_20735, partial [Candidatus Hinthialibacter sp.]
MKIPLWKIGAVLSFLGVFFSGCQKNIGGFLGPKDFLKTPSIINPSREYGHLKTDTVVVPATTDIFLAGAESDVVLEYPEGGLSDWMPDNAPVSVLDGVIYGGETLDIYATGKARHIPITSLSYGPRGWLDSNIIVKTDDVLDIKPFEGVIGSLVGLFDNQREPFIIGRHK